MVTIKKMWGRKGDLLCEGYKIKPVGDKRKNTEGVLPRKVWELKTVRSESLLLNILASERQDKHTKSYNFSHLVYYYEE